MNEKINKLLVNDDRFELDKFALENHLQISKILSYDVIEIEIGEILRQQNNKIFNISKSAPSEYLKSNNINDYKKYCDEICVGEDKEHHSIEIFDKLISDLDANDYDLKKGAIVINQLNIIMDGQHRSSILCNKYGMNHKVKVVKIHYLYLGIRTYINYIKYKFFGDKHV